MKKNEKILIGVLVLITVIVIIVALVNRNKGEENNTNNMNTTVDQSNENEEEFVNTLADGTKLNTSEELHKTKTFDGMEISDFQLTENGNVTLLLGTITNTSNVEKGGYPVDIKVLDKEGKEIITIGAYISKLQPGQSTQLNTSATFDYANAYDFEITKK